MGKSDGEVTVITDSSSIVSPLQVSGKSVAFNTTAANGRTADHPIDPMFLERWSPRAFTGENLAAEDMLTMLEAARWAPSCYNSQPWRFVYARRDTPHWDRFLDLLAPFNRSWATAASALMILVSNSLMRPPGSDKDVPSTTHSFDTGTASGYFALQANKMGWHVHGMVGFDKERAFAELNVPPAIASRPRMPSAASAIRRACRKT